jgi:hypothetical protein
MQPATRPTRLTSNGVAISFDTSTFAPQREVTDWRARPALVREHFAADGHVLLRGVLDRDEVLAVREAYFAQFDPSLLKPGTTPRDGIFSGVVPDGLPEYGTPGHPAHDFVRGAQFDAFSRSPQLHDIAELLLGGAVELVPRRILRHFHRGAGRASRAHVDFDYLDHGGDRIVTAWVPLGDCAVDGGGLVYLERSHTFGRAQLDPLREESDRRAISSDLGSVGRALGGRWLWADYRAGDVVFHSPHIVHASLDNMSDVMRLSTDLRFRLRDEQPDERWNDAWSADDGY